MPRIDNLTIAGVTHLRRSDVAVVKALINWSYKLRRANAFEIANATLYSESQVTKVLRRLKKRGLIYKSQSGSYFLRNHFKERIIANNELMSKTSQAFLPESRKQEHLKKMSRIYEKEQKRIDRIKKQEANNGKEK